MDNINDRFADMWVKSRKAGGRSQDYMAKALGVSKKTVQNWEAGYSCPSQLMGFQWFNVLGIQPLPYYLELLYPDVYGDLNPDSNDEDITTALLTLIKDMPIEMQRKILYILSGRHGGSIAGMIELLVAHVHTPLRARVNVAQHILTNYRVAEAHNELSAHIKPDTAMLDKSIQSALESVYKDCSAYSNLGGDKG